MSFAHLIGALCFYSLDTSLDDFPRRRANVCVYSSIYLLDSGIRPSPGTVQLPPIGMFQRIPVHMSNLTC